jgi:hypothetical protein
VLEAERGEQREARGGELPLGAREGELGGGEVGLRLREVDARARAGGDEALHLLQLTLARGERLARDGDLLLPLQLIVEGDLGVVRDLQRGGVLRLDGGALVLARGVPVEIHAAKIEHRPAEPELQVPERR